MWMKTQQSQINTLPPNRTREPLWTRMSNLLKGKIIKISKCWPPGAWIQIIIGPPCLGWNSTWMLEILQEFQVPLVWRMEDKPQSISSREDQIQKGWRRREKSTSRPTNMATRTSSRKSMTRWMTTRASLSQDSKTSTTRMVAVVSSRG